VISSATGQEEEAIKMWDILAENYKSPFVQARAELSRVLWGMERGTINKDQAVERLERLRLAWHGDNLELKVLSLLGNFYAERKDYANSMRVWDGAVSSFPNTAVAVEMERKLEDAFISLFDEGAAGRMQPLDVLTLYYQYRTHAPGGNVGNQLVSLLADKLVAVDLLDEGAALLDKKMRETEKDQRSEIGAKLAAVHLLNNHPQKALIALQDSVYGDVPQALVLWRNRLLAQSLSELGKHERALQIVQGDLSPDAETIRLGVYWQRRDWGKIIESAEAILKVRKHVGKQLSLDESDAVIKLALAYIFEDNKVQLQYLRDYFKPLMASNPYKPLFEYITAKDVVLTPTNFDEMMGSVSQTRSFLDGYRARIRTAGLGTVTGIPVPENVKNQ
jgi:tetratricopeptide (TPR) repeat protein